MRTLFFAFGVLVLAGCSGGSQFPEPTGKGTFRAINAVADSPTLEFRVENAGLVTGSPFFDTVSFRSVSGAQEIDDFDYEFNFDYRFPTENTPRRLISRQQKIDADQDYTFVLTGSMASPEVSVWTSPEREFDSTDTVFEVRFAHLAASLGRVDVYFAAPGTAPVLGNARGTLEFGETLEPQDLPEGDFELVVTAENDPATILYQSISATYAPRIQLIVSLFDGTVDDTAPLAARALPVGIGNPILSLPDARFGSTVRFVQASRDIATADIYDDEALMNRVVADHAYQDVTAEFPIASGETTFTYTAAGNTGVVQLEPTVIASTGNRYTLYSLGAGDTVRSLFTVDLRRPIPVFAQLALYNADASRAGLFFYLLEPGASIEEGDPAFFAEFGNFTGFFNVVPGDYDLVVTATDSTDPLAPAIPLSLTEGVVIRLMAFATADPNVLDVQPLP